MKDHIKAINHIRNQIEELEHKKMVLIGLRRAEMGTPKFLYKNRWMMAAIKGNILEIYYLNGGLYFSTPMTLAKELRYKALTTPKLLLS
jgi:hypothetical protein